METVDAVIVGAGVVGLATAARLARENNTVVVLEKNSRHGMETSSRNSEVIHAGLYYPSQSLKARFCVEGNRRLYDLCHKNNLFCSKCGKLIIASSPDEIPKLEKLLAQGQANGVESLRMADKAEVNRLAPGVRAAAGLWSGQTGIVDTEDLMRYYLLRAQDQGTMFLWNSPLESVEQAPEGYRLHVHGMDEPIATPRVINASGLQCDQVAKMLKIDIDAAGYKLSWFKGEYYNLRKKIDISVLVYPVPTTHSLGLHLTLDRQGQHRLGPNAFEVRDMNYDVDLSHRQDFWESASKYLEGIEPSDLFPGTSGIRPKLSNDGSFKDFIIQEESSRGFPGWVNLIGIDSPGLTSSPAIADAVANVLEWPD